MIARHDQRVKPVTTTEFALLVLSLLVIGGAWAAFSPGGQVVGRPQTEVLSIAESGDAGKQAVLSLVYVVNLVMLVVTTRWQSWRFIGLPLAALLLWCVLSTTWSYLPDGTVRRATAMAGTMAVGLYIGLRFDEKKLSAVLTTVAAIAAVGSLLWGVVSHDHAFDTDGNLRGLFYHKNVLGYVLALSMLTILYRMTVLRVRRVAYFGLLATCMLTFMLAHSATPIVGMTVALLSLTIAHFSRGSAGPMQVLLPAGLAILIAAVLIFSGDLSVIAATVLDRDPSMSGRTAIWAFVIPMIANHPWLGYGYGIFWLGEEAPGALFWYWSKQFELHAHDGYLQLLLDGGAVGLALFMTAAGWIVVHAIRLNGRGRWTLSLWLALLIGFFLTCNITDSELWQPNSLMTTLFIWAVVRVNLETDRTALVTLPDGGLNRKLAILS